MRVRWRSSSQEEEIAGHPPKGGWLDSAVPQSGITPAARFPSLPAAAATPKGLALSSRGQGHAFCARRPRMASPIILPTLKGSNCRPQDREGFRCTVTVGFTHGY